MAIPHWMQKATKEANKPKLSVIARLKQNLGGPRPGRSRSVVHASDITKIDFCPRQWAFLDMEGKQTKPEFLPTALEATYDMGRETARVLIEKWAGDSVIGNWYCRRCGAQQSMCPKPLGICFNAPGADKSHLWTYIEPIMQAPEYGVSGSLDAIFDVGVPLWLIVELKIMDKDEFNTILAPLPEHRQRTNLYLHLIANSQHPYRHKFNLHEARVLYVCRGYGKKNEEWGEILPFKEFVVERDDQALQLVLNRAKELKLFRDEKTMPSGICPTALDKIAKKCSFCIQCFSGKWPAGKQMAPTD